MNGTVSSISNWFNVLSEQNKISNHIIAALPSIYLAKFSNHGIDLASQNVSQDHVLTLHKFLLKC